MARICTIGLRSGQTNILGRSMLARSTSYHRTQLTNERHKRCKAQAYSRGPSSKQASRSFDNKLYDASAFIQKFELPFCKDSTRAPAAVVAGATHLEEERWRQRVLMGADVTSALRLECRALMKPVCVCLCTEDKKPRHNAVADLPVCEQCGGVQGSVAIRVT